MNVSLTLLFIITWVQTELIPSLLSLVQYSTAYFSYQCETCPITTLYKNNSHSFSFFIYYYLYVRKA